MRIGLDVTPLASTRSGIARYTAELLAALRAAAPDNDVVAVGNRPIDLARSSGAPSLRGTGAGVLGPRFPSRAAWTFGLLPLWLRRSGLDVFHATGYYAPLAAGVPTVVTIHDLSAIERPEVHPAARALRARVALPVIAGRAAAVIVPSAAVKAEVLRRLPVRADRVHVVPEAPAAIFRGQPDAVEVTRTLERYGLARRSAARDGVDRRGIDRLGLPAAGVDPSGPDRAGPEAGFFLAVGTLEPRKNLGRVFEALAALRRADGAERVRLVVAGPDGWKFDPIAARVDALGLGNAVRFLGFVPDADLRALMSAAAGLVYPSLYEGFGLPIVEAMAAGLPVITSHSGATAEVAGDAAVLVDPLDVGAIVVAMRGLLEPSERARRAALGTARAAEYSWQRTAVETLTVYEAALGRSGAMARSEGPRPRAELAR